MARFSLGDDGTMDTVVYCELCGHEDRYNYDGDFMPLDASEPVAVAFHDAYDEFVQECIEQSEDEHECPVEAAAQEENPRERYDDDGQDYSDPRDFRDGRE
jgi:hypothetical protein